MNANRNLQKAALLGLALILLAGCGAPPAELAAETGTDVKTEAPPLPEAQPTPEPPVQEPKPIPVLMAAAPPESERNLQDSDASIRAYEKRAIDGDNILDNLYERPFTSQEMVYLPDVDIYSVDIAQDEDFFYFTISLNNVDPVIGRLTGTYGIEFDRTQSGRGDLLVLAHDLKPEWTSENVTAFIDPNKDVGGLNPTLAEADFEGDGYESTVAFEGERVAHARLHPEDPAAMQIAVSRALLDNAEDFLWGAWADKVIHDPAKFDYNDIYRRAEAGSPTIGDYYPLQQLHSLDNTCRLTYGSVSGIIPGMCISVPKPEPGKSCFCIAKDRQGNCTAYNCN